MKVNRFKKNKAKSHSLKNKKKEWKNPLFNKPEKSIWIKLNFTFVVFIIALVVYFLLFSSLFKITNIKFSGPEGFDTSILKKTIDDQLQNEKVLFLPKDNLILFSKNNLINSFKNHPTLKRIVVKKKPFHSLEINYSLRQAEILIFNQNIYWTADREGYILSVVENENEFNGPKIYDKFQDYNVTEKVSYHDKLNSYIETWSDVQNKYSALEINPLQINILAKENNFELVVNKGWKVIFTTDYEIDKQLQILTELINDKIENLENLNYIDLRIENWIYYQ